MIFNPVYGGASAPNLGSKTITQNGTYLASDDNLDGYDEVIANVSGTKVYDVIPVNEYAISFTPTENANSAKSGGFSFTSTKRIKVSKIRIFARGTTASGYISQNGTNIASATNVTVTDGQWNDLVLDSAVILEPNTTYLVWGSLNGTALKYTLSNLTPAVSYITKGTTYYATSADTLPTNSEAVTTYGIDFYVDGYLEERQNVDSVTLGTKAITANGTYDAEDDDLDGYSSVAVNVEITPNLQAKTGLNITANGSFSYTPDAGYDGLSEVSGTVNVSGGGGTPGIYAGTTAPTSDIGSDGDYYYKRELQTGGYGVDAPFSGSSSQTKAGWEFYPNTDITLSGLRGRLRSSGTGSLVIAVAGSSTPLKTISNVSFTAGVWTDAQFDTPLTLTANTHYTVQVWGNGLSYSQSSMVFNPKITYVRGRWNGLPGNQESNTIYSADIIIAGDGLYHVTAEYYKSNGAWSQI